MKQITLSIKEFYIFKEIAQFFYTVFYSNGSVVINANEYQLEQLGY